MLISNLEFLPGQAVGRHLGLVQGSSVRSKHVGRDIMATLKNIFGGELKGYTELLHDSREEAMQRMVQQAESIGADAVLNVRFSTSSITAGAAEIYVYGSAVELSSATGAQTGTTGADVASTSSLPPQIESLLGGR